MIIALRAKDKLGFVTGKISKPNSDAPEYKKWITVDSMIISWILNSISRDLSDGFLYAPSAHDLWNDIAERFGESNGPLFFQIKKELANISQGSMTLAAYYNKLKRYWDELSILCLLPPCACGVAKELTAFEERERLIQFLMGLNHQYENVSNQILLLDSLPSASKAYGMVQNVEKQKEIQVTFPESSDITTNKADRYCDFCQTSGHLKEKCFKLHGYPEWFSDFKKQKYGAKSNNTMAFNTIAESPLDTETTNAPHIVTDNMINSISRIVQFEISKALKGKSIQSRVEEVATAHQASSFAGIASVNCSSNFKCMDKGTWIIDSGATYHMSGDLALFDSISKLKTPRHVRLPDGRTKLVTHIGTIQLSPRITLFNTFYITDFHCNLLLGHPSTNKMRHLSVVPIISSDVLPCTVCPMAKQERFVFPSKVEHSLTIFELLHMDLWGPYRIKSVTGAYYMFTIVDDHSRFTWTYMLNSKTQVPYFPLYFWSETLLTATHLINRLPSEILKWKSPYELVHGHKPKLDYLRVIGSLCFATNLSPGKTKFSVRGLPSVLLGYGPQQKGYKLYNLHTKQIYISRGVRFHENVFPFHLTNPSSVKDFCLPECIVDEMAIHSSTIPIEPSFNPLTDQIPNVNISDLSLSSPIPSMGLSSPIHNSTPVEPNIELEPLSTEITMCNTPTRLFN
ncbi:hypothetical protein MANES_11G086565v8 [Manihot esculenta]|uniref:Uncharacterized protein n=1 Tax=Manihot esculenta TaxID=3983 RepID=A0ACB7GW08_MANES|nr:hypothetical protein MANES_11G086565v8 [Manihot esculenta]